MDGPSGMHFVTHLVTRRWGLNALQRANHMDHPCTFGKSWGLNMLQSANHRDYPYFWKARDQIQNFGNHKDHLCTLLETERR
ncbi:hypothetical protein Hanom_Chr11g01053991 [Helianthus anomalus]